MLDGLSQAIANIRERRRRQRAIIHGVFLLPLPTFRVDPNAKRPITAALLLRQTTIPRGGSASMLSPVSPIEAPAPA